MWVDISTSRNGDRIGRFFWWGRVGDGIEIYQDG